MTEHVTIHFQEGFSGQMVELWAGPKRLGHWPMRTRLQTGMAHIEAFDVKSGQQLRLVLPDAGLETHFAAPDAQGPHIFLVNHDGQQLRITATEDEPGYL